MFYGTAIRNNQLFNLVSDEIPDAQIQHAGRQQGLVTLSVLVWYLTYKLARVQMKDTLGDQVELMIFRSRQAQV